MTSINNPGASGIANLQGTSTSVQDTANEGLSWGTEIADSTASDGSFNFDNYAAGVAASMSAAGFSASQVTAFINSAYAGYLLEGGLATSENTGTTPSTSFISNPGQGGSLDLPGANGNGGYEAGGGSVQLGASTAYNLGMQYGSQSTGVNFDQWKAGLVGDLTRAGFSPAAISTFSSALDAGHSAGLSSAASTTNTNNTNTTNTNTTNTTNTNNTNNTNNGGVNTTGAANTTPTATSTGTDLFGNTKPGATPLASVSMYTEYLNSSNPTLLADANALQGDLTSLNQTVANLTFAQSSYLVAQSSPNGTAPDSTGTMQNAAYWRSQTGNLASQEQVQWQNVSKDEAKFFGDVAAISSDPNQSTAAAVYHQFQSNPWYSLEGQMPSSFTGQFLNSTNTSNATTTTTTPVSSQALNILTQYGTSSNIPSDASNILTDASGAQDVSQQDFEQLVAGYAQLYANNPQQYWASLAAVKDPKLAGALNYATQDMVVNHPQELSANGASQTQQNSQIDSYFNTMHGNTSTYLAWAPNAGDTQYNGSLSDVLASTKWNDSGSIKSYLTDPNAITDGKTTGHDFSDACQFMAYLYKNNKPQYYALLGQIANPEVKDAVNRAVQLEFQQHPDNFDASKTGGGTGGEDKDFQGEYVGSIGQAGTTGGSGHAHDTGVTFNPSSTTNGK